MAIICSYPLICICRDVFDRKLGFALELQLCSWGQHRRRQYLDFHQVPPKLFRRDLPKLSEPMLGKCLDRPCIELHSQHRRSTGCQEILL